MNRYALCTFTLEPGLTAFYVGIQFKS